MKKRPTARLPLRTETLRPLADGELAAPRGGTLLGGYYLGATLLAQPAVSTVTTVTSPATTH